MLDGIPFRLLFAVLCCSMGGTLLAVDDGQEARQELLKRFAAEFVEITPGEGKFSAPSALKTSFAMAKYEVPQNLYAAVMQTNPSRWKGPRNSVEMMTYEDATEFCRRATTLLQEAGLIADDVEIRLPTETEWEYCCRAGSEAAYSFGEETRRSTDPPGKHSILDEHAWHAGNAAGNDPPVGALKPNRWGLYDMHGYLWEMTRDAWHAEQTPPPNKSVATESIPDEIAIRGGSWKDDPRGVKSTSRRAWGRRAKDDAVGFRCVKAKRL